MESLLLDLVVRGGLRGDLERTTGLKSCDSGGGGGGGDNENAIERIIPVEQ